MDRIIKTVFGTAYLRLLGSGLLLLITSALLTGCYKDMSTLATNPIADLSLDTTGISKNLYVEYLDELVLEPKLQSEEGLTFKWELFATNDENNLKRELIGTDLKLRYTIDKPQSNTPYRLLLTITDTKHDNLESLYSWSVTVQGSILSGLLVAETSDGETTELSYIKDRNVTVKYDREPKVFRQMLKATPTGPVKGLVNNLIYTYFGYKGWMSPGTVVWVTTEDGRLLQLDHKDFNLLGDLSTEKLVAYKPDPNLKAKNLHLSARSLFLDSSAGYYWINNVNGGAYYREAPFFADPDPLLANVHMSNGVAGCYSDGNPSSMILWYDDTTGEIRTICEKNYVLEVSGYLKNATFDPDNLPGQEAVAIAYTEDGKGGRLLLRSKSDRSYSLYTVTHYVPEKKDWRTKEIIQYEAPASANRAYTISSEGAAILRQAKSVFFAERNNVFYAVTDQAVYAFTYGLSDEVATPTAPVYMAPAGETLTMGCLFVQGDYAQQKAVMKKKQLPWNEAALILVSQKGTGKGSGTVRIVPIDPDRAAAGTLLTSQAIEYTGFDKILNVTHIGD